MVLRSGRSYEVAQRARGNTILCIVDIDVKGCKEIAIVALKRVFGNVAEKVSELRDDLCRYGKRCSRGLSIRCIVM